MEINALSRAYRGAGLESPTLCQLSVVVVPSNTNVGKKPPTLGPRFLN